VVILTDLQIDIKEPEVLRQVGYKERVPRGRIAETVQKAVNLGYQLVKPLALYTRFTIKETDETSLLLADGTRLNIGRLIKLWQGAEQVTAALCTVGAELEQLVSVLFAKGEPLLAWMLDGVGSAAIDNLESQVQQLICQEAHQSGLIVGAKLSPGSGEWPLQEQQTFFSLFPAEKIGVRLTEHCMMIPRKSVSFCTASAHKQLWRGLDSAEVSNPCQLCHMVNCQYRRPGP